MPESIEALIERMKGGDPFALGAIPSVTDERDYALAKPQAPTSGPATAKGAGATPVYSQQGGTCTGYSLAAILSMLEYAETGSVLTFDGSDIHHRVVPSYEAGSMPRDLLENVRMHGALARKSASHEGQFRIAGYAQVDKNDRAAVTAAVAQGPLLVATWLSQAFFDAWYSRTIDFVAPKGDGQGYHAMVVVHADPNRGITFQNSWGEGGGHGMGTAKGGFVSVSWEYVTKEVGELWAVADVRNDTVEGYIKTHEDSIDPVTKVRLVKRKDRPAVYVLMGGTRWWIQSQAALDAMKLRGTMIESLSQNDAAFGYPVVGPDAPQSQRA